MFELQDVFSRFGNRFIDSNTVHYEGLKAIKAIMNCRTSSLGGHVDVCDSCGSRPKFPTIPAETGIALNVVI